MIMDDGVTACLGENHFHMTTTTGGAAGVLDWMEMWHQTEWPELEVYFKSVTDHWAAMALNGPNARKLLAELTDIDLSKDKFGFMDWREGTVAGVPARVFRISFTGELSYEINVQANHAMHVWKALFEKGEKYGLTPYGTETMHVLRAEKGFVIIGQDTDGSVTPEDLGMQWCVGYRSRSHGSAGARCRARTPAPTASSSWSETARQQAGARRGAQIVLDKEVKIPMPMVGHVTSSYFSPTLGHSSPGAAQGRQRIGQTVYLPMADGQYMPPKSSAPSSTILTESVTMSDLSIRPEPGGGRQADRRSLTRVTVATVASATKAGWCASTPSSGTSSCGAAPRIRLSAPASSRRSACRCR